MANDFAQLVKTQADIVKIVGEYVRLRKSGAQNWTGLCPFHSEKSGSFSVHAARQFYHCFGCGQSGDVFSFLQKIENLSFPEAVKAVAVKTGIPLPRREFSSPEEAAENRQRNRLIELHEQAASWFEQQLQTAEGASAREYLSGRGLTAEGIAKFRIGFGPESYHALREHLQKLADPESVRSGSFQDALRLSGLFSWKEQEDGTQGQLYARFRKRITFPILNEQGRVIAFTARALESGDKAGPKYLNSPETPLYSKGNVLFNLDKARVAIRQFAAQKPPQDFALLVEGQMDCISVYLAGIHNVLATSGTAFTETQARLLGRQTKRVIVNFDPDLAGGNAAEKSIALLVEEGFDVRVVTLEDGLDPDRFLRERGFAAYAAAVRGARKHTDFLLDRARQLHPPTTPEGKILALNFLLPHIRRMPNAISRQDFAAEAAHRLGIDSALVRDELKQAVATRREHLPAQARLALSEAERDLLRSLATPPGSPLFTLTATALDAHPAYFEGLGCQALLTALRGREGEDPLAAIEDDAARGMLARVLMAEGRPLEPGDVRAAIESLRRTSLEREQRQVRGAIAEAERRGDMGRMAELMRQKQELDRELREL
jgi:DNA primase